MTAVANTKTDIKNIIIVAQLAAAAAFYSGWQVRENNIAPIVQTTPVTVGVPAAASTVETAPSGATAVVPGK